MKAPDKIYIPITDYELPTTNDWSGLPLSQYEWKPVLENIAYIRKDALLEWARNLKERWEEPPMSKHSPGCVYMLEQLIDKLESL